MTVSKRLCVAAMSLWVATMAALVPNAWGQAAQRDPHIGYFYPGGGRQGTTFEVVVGGQLLRGAGTVYVSGEGVSASVLEYYPRINNVKKEQRDALQARLNELRQMRAAEAAGNATPASPHSAGAGAGAANEPKAAYEVAELPRHPLLRNLDEMSLRELDHVAHEIRNINKRQLNQQIAESVVIEVTIEPDAPFGNREIRLGVQAGLTNPMYLQISPFPEARELEPNDAKAAPNAPVDAPVDLPVVLNGQIMPGDVDRLRIRARQGQRLVMEAKARQLVPYLADAVPGWFQATLALYDAQGNEVAFTDDYRFDPDPVLFYEIPADGEYEVEIRDAIYRGREDFVYRITVGELPFITHVFPLGGQEGAETIASIAGWNLSTAELPLDTQPGAGRVRRTALREGGQLSNEVPYEVDALPESDETEPNDTPEAAQPIVLPRIVNGRIGQPGDVDVFRFEGHAGDSVATEVYARRLHSPVDSLLRLSDASGAVLEWNDDHEDKESGLLTHHADSCLCAKLPADGVYFIRLADSERHGGDEYGYRLRIAAPRPDFALRMAPSSINVPTGRATPIAVHAMRKDGFAGDIEVALKDAPSGFVLCGGRIPSGKDSVRMTLTAPWQAPDGPVVLSLEGRGQIDGQPVSRPVVPSEDMMQAFAYRHLVPAEALMVAVVGPRRAGASVTLASNIPVRIPAGGSAEVRVTAPKGPMLESIQLELSDPPQGVTLQDVTVTGDGLAFLLKAGADAPKIGFADNLIVQVSAEVADKQAPAGQKPPAEAAEQKRRVALGALPAIPIEVVQQ